MECSLNWQDIRSAVGSCLRPGGLTLTERALEICDLSTGSWVADIGCGAGKTMELLGRIGTYHVIGLDYSGSLLDEVTAPVLQGHLVKAQAEILPFKKGSFDALFCECVLSILTDRSAALNEFTRILKEDAFLIASDLFNQSYPDQDLGETRSQESFTDSLPTKGDLLRVLTRLGFSILLWEEHKQHFIEFVARMILAGISLPHQWRCMMGQERKTDRSRISYFLLVAQKKRLTAESNKNKGIINSG